MSQTPVTSSFIEHLGLQVTDMRDGRAELWLEIRPCHLNSGGVLHGGVIGSLVDSAAGAAVYSTLARGERAVTTDLHLTCMRNIGSGTVQATAELTYRGRRFLNATVRVCSGDQLLATGTVSMLKVVRTGKPPAGAGSS